MVPSRRTVPIEMLGDSCCGDVWVHSVSARKSGLVIRCDMEHLLRFGVDWFSPVSLQLLLFLG